MRTISIAKDFSMYPGGRVPADGPYSGEEFRKNFLIPAIKNKEKVIIDFDGVRGYGSSFLEEAFGGLVRNGITKKDIYEFLSFATKRKSIIEEIERYIEEAE